MADLQQIEESIVNLSLLEAAELVKKLESRLGVSAAAAAPVMVAGGGAAAGGAAPAAEEKTEFQVILKDAGANKINTIKAVREDGVDLICAGILQDDLELGLLLSCRSCPARRRAAARNHHGRRCCRRNAQ